VEYWRNLKQFQENVKMDFCQVYDCEASNAMISGGAFSVRFIRGLCRSDRWTDEVWKHLSLIPCSHGKVNGKYLW